ncbi:NAD+ synthase [Lujinxingia sediminis]|uniref:Glutamine-dependent NAD(+) synthetase n=1 Tax=Lujinxingia sediminis TaxID=2480984 RepID=A0ABY0CU70_9DELT|nr:NAD+ synthase [Lujinxingia sediminis]RVU45874.1 NAD+ synthase [Lujinxingia sediminis]
MIQTPSSLRIALAQLNFKVGDLDRNVARIRDEVERARAAGADLLVTSELALTGYPPRDLLHHDAFIDAQLKTLEALAKLSDDDFALIVGYADRNPHPKGRRLVNAAAFCVGGRVKERVFKQLLPEYDVFDEARYFEPGGQAPIFTFKGVRLGVSICEDAWARVEHREQPRYAGDPVGALVVNGAQVLINISASPFARGKRAMREAMLAEHASRHKRPLIFVNQVGATDELIFEGASVAIDAEGRIAHRLSDFSSACEIVEVNPCGEVVGPAGGSASVRDAIGELRAALVLGTRDYVRKSGFKQVLLGLSGGIDSAVTAVIAADALGPENVHAVAMPSRYSSRHSRDDARTLANNLGIEFDEIGIEQPYSSFLDVLTPHFKGRDFDVTEENLQARIRGVYLMGLSNKFGKLVLSCGNKSELAVGYSTLYGDMCGALAVIGDVPKMQVYALAEEYNRLAGYEVVPRSIIEKAPSAELRPDQRDEDSLPPYPVLDAIVDRYVEDRQSIAGIIEAGFERRDVERVVGLIQRNEYKRWQCPPVLKVTAKAFGSGWRYPLAASHG